MKNVNFIRPLEKLYTVCNELSEQTRARMINEANDFSGGGGGGGGGGDFFLA